MIKFRQLTSIEDEYFNELYNLYVTSFPVIERRSLNNLVRELNAVNKFSVNALVESSQFVGLFNFWNFETFFYIEHFAIVSGLRGQLKGTQTLDIFKSMVDLPIVFEVEMATNSETVRRIRFYENLGFKVLSHLYVQPPYESADFLMPMLLMSNNYHFGNTHFETIKMTLYNEVYHFRKAI